MTVHSRGTGFTETLVPARYQSETRVSRYHQTHLAPVVICRFVLVRMFLVLLLVVILGVRFRVAFCCVVNVKGAGVRTDAVAYCCKELDTRVSVVIVACKTRFDASVVDQ